MATPRLVRVAEQHDTNDNAPDKGAAVDPEAGLDTPALAKLREIGASMAKEMGEVSAPAATEATPAPDREQLRIVEALLFAASEPLDEASIAHHLKGDHDIKALLAAIEAEYATRGVNLVRVAGKWALRTAGDLSWLLEKRTTEEKRLSRAALETLAIIAYHQPVTRAEIEDIRGVTTSKGTLDVLLETGWIRPRGRRRAPGKPVTYGTTAAFLEHFGLDAVGDLPGLSELKAAGLLDGNLPPGFAVPSPTDVAALMPDELPLELGGDDDEAAQAEFELDAADDIGDDEAADDDTDRDAGGKDGASET
jgi:segregation and condensation protein B